MFDVIEDEGGVRKFAVGGDGGELQELRTVRGERVLEKAGGDEMRLNLFDVRERVAFLD